MCSWKHITMVSLDENTNRNLNLTSYTKWALIRLGGGWAGMGRNPIRFPPPALLLLPPNAEGGHRCSKEENREEKGTQHWKDTALAGPKDKLWPLHGNVVAVFQTSQLCPYRLTICSALSPWMFVHPGLHLLAPLDPRIREKAEG